MNESAATFASVPTATSPQLRNAVQIIGDTKWCSGCKEYKPYASFPRNSGRVSGLSRECRDCTRTRDAVRRKLNTARNAEREIPDAHQKQCRLCGQQKYASGYHRRRCTPDGLSDTCKDCTRTVNRGNYLKRMARTSVPLPPSKVCFECGEQKPASHFYRGKQSKDGLFNRCRPCHLARQRNTTHTLAGCLSHRVSNLRLRAARAGIAFELTRADLEQKWLAQGGICPYTGVKMTHQQCAPGSQDYFGNVSVDRIDSTKGYTPDNIQLVCTWANVAKSNLSDADFRGWITRSARHLVAGT